MEYRPNTNVAILWNTGHTKGRSCTEGVGKLRTWIWLIYSLYKNEYKNLKLAETTIRKGLEEINQLGLWHTYIYIYIYMEISQGNSLCSYLYLKQAKMFFILSFLFFLLQNWRTGGWKNSCPEGRAGTSGRGKWWGKRVGGWIQCKKLCMHVCKCKKWYWWKYYRNWGEEDKEEW
jgi:hypothetical protein